MADTDGEGLALDGAAPFLGEYRHALDEKGRLFFPSAFRPPLAEGLVITVGHDRCLAVLPQREWAKVVSDLRHMRSTDRRERAYVRMVTSSAQPDTLDKQGRVTIPPRLRDYAGLQRDVAIVGCDNQLELWDAPTWEAYWNEAIAEFAGTEQPFDVGGF